MIGVRVRQAILNAGRTQSSVAEQIDLTVDKLSKSLSGSRTFRDTEIDKLSEALGISRDYLLHGAGADEVGQNSTSPSERILDAAAKLIATQGFHTVRVADIAQACAVSTGTIHYYFPTRDDVLTAALQHYAQRMFARLEDVLNHLDGPAEQLRYLIDSQLPTDSDVRDEWSVWVQFWTEAMLIPALRPAHNQLYARWRTIVDAVVNRAASAGLIPGVDPATATIRFTTLLDGAAIQLLTQAPDFDVERVRALLHDVFWPPRSV